MKKSSIFVSNHNIWKLQKKSHSTLKAKRAMFTFWVDKSSLKMTKKVSLAIFWKPEFCSQTVLPDRSILSGQKLVKNDKIQKLKCAFWVDKNSLKMPKIFNLASFWKPEFCSQTVLPDRLILIGKKNDWKCQNWKLQMRHYFKWTKIY